MTIAMVGHSDLTYTADGGLAVEWPDGTAAGHTGIVVTATAGSGKPATVLPDGWKLLCVNSAKEAIWGKLVLTEADIADDLDLNAVISGLVVLSGVKVFGAASPSKGVTLTEPDGAMITFGRKSTSSPALTPPTGRIFATDAINDKYKKSGKKWLKRRYNAWLTIPGAAGYRSISSNADALMSVELVGSVSASATPAAMTPTILTPADDSSVARAGSYSFEWSLPSAYASPQWTVRQVQLRAAGAGTWGTVSGGVFYPADSTKTELASFSGSQTRTSMTSALAAGQYQWRVRMQYAGSVWSAWSEVADFTVVAPPVVSSVVMTAALQPVVSWTISSGTQAYHQVRVLTAAGAVVYDAGLVASSAGPVTVPAQEWVNGGSYHAVVTAVSPEGMVSESVASPNVTIAWTPPPAPSGVASVAGSPLSLTVYGLTAVHDEVRVRWTSHDVAYEAVVDAAVGAVSVPLPMAPYGPCTYTVDASKSQDGVSLWSSVRTVAVENADRSAYLASVDDPADWLPVWMHTASEPVDSEGIAVAYPLGATRPVTMRTPSAGMSGTDVFYVADRAAKDALLSWLRDHPVCYFRRPPERGDDGTYADTPVLRIARSSARSEARLAQTDIQMRTIPVSWVESD